MLKKVLCLALLAVVSNYAYSQNCELTPIAIHEDTLIGAETGDIICNVLQGKGAGNFGWLTWTGSPSTKVLVSK